MPEVVVRGALAESARAWLAAGRPTGPPPRPASTVMLVRDAETPCGTEVFMLRRVSSMAFAPSMWVFPGGGVDPRDAGASDWVGPEPPAWAARMEVPAATAAELVMAAAREVFEETGVLLAGSPTAVAAPAADWPAAREALVARELSFAEFLAARGLRLRADLLALQDHWITPEFEPRRYDTWFFAAVMPQGQIADDATSETDLAEWVDPERLLAQAEAGEAAMLPPTVTQLRRLVGASSVADFVRHREPVPTIMPVADLRGEDVVLRTENAGE
ncbi:NUDIX domain-containing protein [Calidifontibacter sp. DB0510]|uniref:NUDIX domain-containing protein n=1 Tax=Metallococcus carri TaxID=1656884 RepID=A0A967B3G5_9MICO|nr:NUDIX domain-containing protein [Metallococcus carri]NHN56833.1 NUDIX domain-containing protein [Metallococcus carri]NOP37790.1 NUDIX domain-containing protein [Calidifontibacter sp. DB2511S]